MKEGRGKDGRGRRQKRKEERSYHDIVVTQSKVDVDAMFVHYNEFCNRGIQWLSSGLIAFYSSASMGAQSPN